jgi:hypothetical protein
MLKLPISQLRKRMDAASAAGELEKTVRGQEVQLVIDQNVSDDVVGSVASWLRDAGAIAIALKYRA